jgi:signal peptidase I
MENTPPLPPPKGESSFKAFLLDVLKYFIIALVITLPIKKFVAQPFVVSGTSMVPTFEDGEYLIIDEISYRLHDPARGDVIVFRYPKDPSRVRRWKQWAGVSMRGFYQWVHRRP